MALIVHAPLRLLLLLYACDFFLNGRYLPSETFNKQVAVVTRQACAEAGFIGIIYLIL